MAKKLDEALRENERLKHKLTCDSCCGQKTVDCICLDSDESMHGTIEGQRMGLRRLLQRISEQEHKTDRLCSWYDFKRLTKPDQSRYLVKDYTGCTVDDQGRATPQPSLTIIRLNDLWKTIDDARNTNKKIVVFNIGECVLDWA